MNTEIAFDLHALCFFINRTIINIFSHVIKSWSWLALRTKTRIAEMKRSPRERGAKATRSIVIGPVDRLTVNTEQFLPADGIVVATDGSIIYRQHPLYLMPEATTLDFYATHSCLWNAGRFHASKLLPMIFVDPTHTIFPVLGMFIVLYFVRQFEKFW